MSKLATIPISLLLVVLLVLVSFPCVAVLSVEEQSEIRLKLNAPTWSEETAIFFYERYGDDGVLILMDLLEDPNASLQSKGKASFYLGKLRVHDATNSMIQFVAASLLVGDLTEEDLGGVLGALDGLGFLSSNSSLEYLTKLVKAPALGQEGNPPRCSERNWGSAMTRNYVRKRAVRGIGLAEWKKALPILKSLTAELTEDEDAQLDLLSFAETMTTEVRVESAKYWRPRIIVLILGFLVSLGINHWYVTSKRSSNSPRK